MCYNKYSDCREFTIRILGGIFLFNFKKILPIMLAGSLMMPSAAFGSEINPSIDLEESSECSEPESSELKETISTLSQKLFYELVEDIKGYIPELKQHVIVMEELKNLLPDFVEAFSSKLNKDIVVWLQDLKNTVDNFNIARIEAQNITYNHVEMAQKFLSEIDDCCNICTYILDIAEEFHFREYAEAMFKFLEPTI